MEYVQVGVIVNTHGLQGTVKVKSITDFKEERYAVGNTLYILFKRDYIPVTVRTYKTVKNLEHINFKEFNHINHCEKYKGSKLFISSDKIHDLEEDEFYFGELFDMNVIVDGKQIGTIKDVREMPRGELLVISQPQGKDLLVPFNKEFIKHVDKDKRQIELIMWEGLL